MKDKKAIVLKTLNKGNVWDIQENDVFRLWETAEKDPEVKDNIRKYVDILLTAFELERVKVDRPEVVKKIEARGFKVGLLRLDDGDKQKVGIKKKPIMHVTDLTYENIHHISAAKLIEVLDRNFGGGWESLPQSIQDIIESGFEISTTTLPKDRLHKAGGLYEKKVADGYEVLEIPKGNWAEAIFAKEKPELSMPAVQLDTIEELDRKDEEEARKAEAEETEDLDVEETQAKDEEEEEDYDDEQLTEESYRTTFETDPDDLNIEAEDLAESVEEF